MVVGDIGVIRGAVVVVVVELLLSVGDGVGGIAGMTHFCPYVGVIGDKVGGVVGWSHFHPAVVAGKERWCGFPRAWRPGRVSCW